MKYIRQPNEQMRKGYRVAYTSFASVYPQDVCYPIPLCYVVGITYRAWLWGIVAWYGFARREHPAVVALRAHLTEQVDRAYDDGKRVMAREVARQSELLQYSAKNETHIAAWKWLHEVMLQVAGNPDHLNSLLRETYSTSSADVSKAFKELDTTMSSQAKKNK